MELRQLEEYENIASTNLLLFLLCSTIITNIRTVPNESIQIFRDSSCLKVMDLITSPKAKQAYRVLTDLRSQ